MIRFSSVSSIFVIKLIVTYFIVTYNDIFKLLHIFIKKYDKVLNTEHISSVLVTQVYI